MFGGDQEQRASVAGGARSGRSKYFQVTPPPFPPPQGERENAFVPSSLTPESPTMTPRKQRFIEEYARLKNGKQAALAAGYGERCAAPMASKLLRRADVQEALIARGVELAFARDGVKQMTRVEPFLTERQERFIEHYLVLGKGAEAARRAGYSPRSAPNRADKLLNTPRVAA